MRNRSGAWSRLFLVLTLAVAIFAFSSQNAEQSGEASEDVTLLLLPFFKGADAEVIGAVNHVIRKCAHAAIYAALGGFAVGFWLNLALERRWTKLGGALRPSLLGWGCALLYAISDEVHQIFVPGRGPAVLDVLLDASGAALGAAVAVLIFVLLCGDRS